MIADWLNQYLDQAGAKYTKTIATSPKNPIPANASTVVSASFVRPANTTAYASGQLVANSTAAASVVPLSFTVARMNDASFSIRRARIKTSSTSTTNASFRLHFFRTLPIIATTGDAGTFASVVTGNAGAQGRIDVTVDQAYADGANGQGVPITGGEITALPATGTEIIYVLVEARGAYTPTSGETFTVELEVLQN